MDPENASCTTKRQRVGMAAGATWAAQAMLNCYVSCVRPASDPCHRIGMPHEKDSVVQRELGFTCGVPAMTSDLLLRLSRRLHVCYTSLLIVLDTSGDNSARSSCEMRSSVCCLTVALTQASSWSTSTRQLAENETQG